MRLTDIFYLAERYLIIGCIAAGFIAGIFCIIYFVLYKKILHGTAVFPLKKLAAAAVILCYLIVVLGATMLDRGAVWNHGRITLSLFLSYREAWYSFSIREWRNIILNICMFIPLGLLLPLYGKYWRKAVFTYLTGLAFTLLIELAQLVFNRGIFELDDIFNNLLGTMIGYGLYQLLHLLPKFHPASGHTRHSCRNKPLYAALLYQIPLIMTVILFGTVFIVYQQQEFGNLREHYIHKADLSATDLQLQTELSSDTQTVPVYQMTIANEAETHALAQALFAKLGTQIDESETDLYDETAIYWSQGRNHNVWIDYAGCRMHFTDFTAYDSGTQQTGKSGCSKEELQTAFGQLGIQIPDSADFQDLGDGKYLFDADLREPDRLCQGSLSCTCDADGRICSFDNSILTYQKYRNCEILSEQEAYDQLKNGKFRTDYLKTDLISITINSVSLSYTADSKGFYQPIYIFSGMLNGETAEIGIPALK